MLLCYQMLKDYLFKKKKKTKKLSYLLKKWEKAKVFSTILKAHYVALGKTTIGPWKGRYMDHRIRAQPLKPTVNWTLRDLLLLFLFFIFRLE